MVLVYGPFGCERSNASVPPLSSPPWRPCSSGSRKRSVSSSFGLVMYSLSCRASHSRRHGGGVGPGPAGQAGHSVSAVQRTLGAFAHHRVSLSTHAECPAGKREAHVASSTHDGPPRQRPPRQTAPCPHWDKLEHAVAAPETQ